MGRMLLAVNRSLCGPTSASEIVNFSVHIIHPNPAESATVQRSAYVSITPASMEVLPSTKSLFVEALDRFKQEAQLSRSEALDFSTTSLDELKDVVRQMEHDQGRHRRLMNMKRLEPFLRSMEAYGKTIEVFVNVNEIVAFIWGPMKFILQIASSFSDALHCILEAYQDIGQEIPLLIGYQGMLDMNDHMMGVLSNIYIDILKFHQEIMRVIRSKMWKECFRVMWKSFNSRVTDLSRNMARNRQMFEKHASMMQLQKVQRILRHQDRDFMEKVQSAKRKREVEIMEWLSPFMPDNLQESYRAVRANFPPSGRWFLESPKIQDWLSPLYCSTPLLWVNGTPGAGKTILASLIVDEVGTMPNASVLYFYFKFRDQARNTMLSATKSIIAQIILGNDDSDVLYQFHDNKSFGGTIALTSPKLATEMLHLALHSTSKTKYIVLDGLDECARHERKDITQWFRSEVDNLPATDRGNIRVLFVSQDDGAGNRYLAEVPIVKVSPTENKDDIKIFAESWHKRIEERFGNFSTESFHVANIITAKSQGVFVFAHLYAEHLYSLGSREQVKQELHSSRSPVKLDHVYERILYRITESRPEAFSILIRKILGWIVSAQRPLKWREIQGAISLDLNTQDISFERRLLDSPDNLFASLIQHEPDDTVTLVHRSAGEYLRRSDFIQWKNTDHSLAQLSLAYLSLPQFDKTNSVAEIKKLIQSGFYSFAEYALSCWSLDLEAAIDVASGDDDLEDLVETLDVFMPMHWKAPAKVLPVPKTLKRKFSCLETAESYDNILQATSWMKMQLKSSDGTCPGEEPSDLIAVIRLIRKVFEQMVEDGLTSREYTELTRFYGTGWYKCHRLDCYYFHQGFCTAKHREEHIARHERPFVCTVTGCHWANFGFATEKEHQKHMFDSHVFDLLNNDEFPEEHLNTASHSPLERALFSCHLCAKKFKRKHNMESHVRLHNIDKPFQCTIFDERFTRKNDCADHESIHRERTCLCPGQLEDDSTCSCEASSGGADQQDDPPQSEVSRERIQPMAMRQDRDSELSTGGDGAQLQKQAALQGEQLLPAFKDFLKRYDLT